MDCARTTKPLDSARRERRTFLKQVAATGAAAAATVFPALPVRTQERLPATPAAPAEEPSVAETLARYALSLEYADLPAEVVRETKRFMIDSIGCGLGGFSADASQIANRLAAGVGAARGATVMCSGVKTSADLAAFANLFQGARFLRGSRHCDGQKRHQKQ